MSTDNARGDEAPAQDLMPLGFIGLGQIGTPMARRLIDWPAGLIVCDKQYRATLPLLRHGASVFKTPAEVAAKAPVISIMVRDDAQVAEVLSGPDGILSTAAPGTIVAIHSTVAPDTPARLAAVAEPHGVTVVDAPVSGGMLGAMDGRLAMMIGGPAEAVDRLREPFSRMATLMAHMGPIGAGTRAKLARNLITFASFSAVGEALRLAQASGVDLGLLGDVVRHSDKITGGPGAVMLRTDSGPLPPTDGLRPVFTHTRELGEKDLALALELGERLGVDLPIAAQAYRFLGEALGVPHENPGTEVHDG